MLINPKIFILMAFVNGSAIGQANGNANTLAKDSYQIVVLSAVAKYANTQVDCRHATKISQVDPKVILESDVKPILAFYSRKEGKSEKHIDATIDELLRAPSAKINNVPVAIYTYNMLKNKFLESGPDYCGGLHTFVEHLLRSHIKSIEDIKKATIK